jgi:hypothetical protein
VKDPQVTFIIHMGGSIHVDSIGNVTETPHYMKKEFKMPLSRAKQIFKSSSNNAGHPCPDKE